MSERGADLETERKAEAKGQINTEEIKIRVEGRHCASTAEGLRVLLPSLPAARSEDWSSRASFLTSEADLMLLRDHSETFELIRKLSKRQRPLLAPLGDPP
jgi:hypothetical protein